MGSDGMGWERVRWDGIRRDAMRCDAMRIDLRWTAASVTTRAGVATGKAVGRLRGTLLSLSLLLATNVMRSLVSHLLPFHRPAQFRHHH